MAFLFLHRFLQIHLKSLHSAIVKRIRLCNTLFASKNHMVQRNGLFAFWCLLIDLRVHGGSLNRTNILIFCNMYKNIREFYLKGCVTPIIYIIEVLIFTVLINKYSRRNSVTHQHFIWCTSCVKTSVHKKVLLSIDMLINVSLMNWYLLLYEHQVAQLNYKNFVHV